MTDISAAAAAAREHARETNGQFGTQAHSAPAPVRSLRCLAWCDSMRDFTDDETAIARAAERYPDGNYRPQLLYASYDDELYDHDDANAYLAGDELGGAAYLNTYANASDSGALQQACDTELRDLFGDTFVDSLTGDDLDAARTWVEDQDDSNIVRDYAQNTRRLVQYAPGGDDLAFSRLLQTNIDDINHPDPDTRYAARLRAICDSLEQAGLDMHRADNLEAAETMLTESPLGWDEPVDASAFKLRVMNYGAIPAFARVNTDTYGAHDRTIETNDPYVYLVNTYLGAGYDAKLRGTVRTTLNDRNNARVDTGEGYGSLEEAAGVVASAYAADTHTMTWQPS